MSTTDTTYEGHPVNAYISQIKLPGDETLYELHDPRAIHDLDDLGLSHVLQFKGTKSSESNVFAITSAEVGDVYLVGSVEYICVTAIDGTANASAWEKLGSVHDAASSTHKHTVTVTGTNTASNIDASVTIPTISRTQKHLTVSAGKPDVTAPTSDALGTGATFTVSGGTANATKQKLDAVVTATAVGANGTASAITALGTPTTKKAAASLNTTTIKNPTVTAGSPASWSATVDDGILTFVWNANKPTAVATDNVTVATSIASTVDAVTAYASPTTKSVLTGVKVITQPTVTLAYDEDGDVDVVTAVSNSAISVAVNDADKVAAVTSVSAAAPTITITEGDSASTGSVPVVSAVTIGSTTAAVTGTAAAQTWKQGTVTVSEPK